MGEQEAQHPPAHVACIPQNRVLRAVRSCRQRKEALLQSPHSQPHTHHASVFNSHQAHVPHPAPSVSPGPAPATADPLPAPMFHAGMDTPLLARRLEAERRVLKTGSWPPLTGSRPHIQLHSPWTPAVLPAEVCPVPHLSNVMRSPCSAQMGNFKWEGRPETPGWLPPGAAGEPLRLLRLFLRRVRLEIPCNEI